MGCNSHEENTVTKIVYPDILCIIEHGAQEHVGFVQHASNPEVERITLGITCSELPSLGMCSTRMSMIMKR